MRRSYEQRCGLARALDVVGERWTLLIVRDLATGPQRFTDLLEGLDGIGTSLLSERLRHLEDADIVRRVAQPRPARGVAYELTQRGRELADAMAPLAAWGGTMLGPRSDEHFRPQWLAYLLKAMFRRDRATGVHDCYELRVEGSVLWVTIDDGTITVAQEPTRDPDFIVTLDLGTLAELGAGHLDPAEAVASGRARFDGDPRVGARALELLGSAPARTS